MNALVRMKELGEADIERPALPLMSAERSARPGDPNVAGSSVVPLRLPVTSMIFAVNGVGMPHAPYQ